MAKLFGGLFGVSADAVLTHAKQVGCALVAATFGRHARRRVDMHSRMRAPLD